MTTRSRLLALTLLLASRGAIAAEGGPSTPGALAVAGAGGAKIEMPLRHTKVAIEVTAFVARTVVEQRFENTFDRPVEAVYTFPLGDRAAVDEFELIVGDRTIRGEIKTRDEAREVYDRAIADGYQAALLDQERPNIFTQRVGNLEPGKSVTVRLRTVETLRYERGTYRLSFPLVIGPRYVPRSMAGAAAARIHPPALPPGTRSGHDVEIGATIDSGVPLRNLRSVSHRVVVQQTGAATARVDLAGGDAIPNKDFQLEWSVGSERPAMAVLAHRDDQDGFFTLVVQPKGAISATEAAPKEIVLVVDTSGSMNGIPLDASKRFIAKALRELGPRDTFNLIRFAGDNTVFSQEPLPNDPREIERAIAWVDAQQGRGGTEMLAALRAAFTRPRDPDRVRVVVFLTDGYVGNDEEILGAIRDVLGDARIDTVGIGSAVNRYLLDRMAALGRGGFVTIRPDESADDALEAFRSWVTRPYLTDLRIDWGSLPVADVQPDPLPDLGSGQTLTLVGRYLGSGAGDVVLRGRLGGRPWEQTLRVELPRSEAAHAALASLWARARIDGLLLSSPAGVPDSVRAEVTDLALSYRLMSPFTSFVAVDDARIVNPSGKAPVVHQPLPVPDGVSFEGVFGSGGPAVVSGKGDEKTEDEERRRDAPSRLSGAVEGVAELAASVLGGRNAAPPPSPRSAPALARVESLGYVQARKNVLSRGAADERDAGTAMSTFALGHTIAAVDAVRDAALRVLADLADDGALARAEGRPALAALMAAQTPKGTISDDAETQALAAWALAEASRALPNDPWVKKAAAKAAESLGSSRTAIARVRASIALKKPSPTGREPLDRLVATIGRGHLALAR